MLRGLGSGLLWALRGCIVREVSSQAPVHALEEDWQKGICGVEFRLRFEGLAVKLFRV